MPSSQTIKFPELYLRGSAEKIPALRQAMIEKASTPWGHSPRDEARARNQLKRDILIFKRRGSKAIRSVELWLAATDDGYELTNIVQPKGNNHNLSVDQFRRALLDFLERMVVPVAQAFGFEIDYRSPSQIIH